MVLHGGAFALQYACAKSWIDSGLKVDAVIGHSFGELTAMTVAGVLSLSDALKFVAARAKSMKQSLSSTSGSMVAIHASADEVRDMIQSWSSGNEAPEVACYNSEGSQVVSGPQASLECLLQSVGKDRKSVKIDVDYGYHSRLLDPILDEVSSVASGVQFRTPSIHIETCTEAPIEAIDASRLTSHTREPVFFWQAIQRLEKRFGRCVWLEAGMRSSIIPMVKRACAGADRHSFLSLAPDAAKDDGLFQQAEITRRLWNEGLNASP